MTSATSQEFLDGALDRAGNSDVLHSFNKTVLPILAANEVILEAAETTAPGHTTGLFITNQRLLLVENLQTVREVRLDALTLASPNFEDGSLSLQVFGKTLTWRGFGERGLERVRHGLSWALTQYNPNGVRLEPEIRVGDLLMQYMEVRTHNGDDPEAIRNVLSNKRWW